jgi:hypothetical protein
MSATNEEIVEIESLPLLKEPENKPLGLAGIPPKPSPKVEYMNVVAPMPFLVSGKVANSYRQLRKIVLESTGIDFLAVCADMMRDKNFNSGKIGVAYRSNHKTGRAFDYDQSSNKLVIVSEPHGTQQFFRTWLKCSKQDSTQGIQLTLRDIRGYNVKAWLFDFTAAAERLGWQRIPAWKGWGLKGSGYNKMELWHYQMMEGLSWDEAMRYIYDPGVKVVSDVRLPPPERILGLNDRGSAVRNLQEKLSKILDKNKVPYLPRNEVDGIYGKITETAVKLLQETYGLHDDGLYGPNTRQLVERLTG